MEKRDVSRMRKLMRIRITNFTPPLQGACLDVSSSGMKIKIRSKRLFNTAEPLSLFIVSNQKEYHLTAQLVWTRRTVLETLIGVHFTQVPMDFLKEILNLDPGSAELPFRINLARNPSGLTEFKSNLKFGGVVIQDGPGGASVIRPDLFQKVHVTLILNASGARYNFVGTVVAHLPNGIGLTVEDHQRMLAELG